MDRACDVCGVAYVAKRKTSKYCSTRCRTRASRSGGGAVVELRGGDEPDVGPVEEATSRALQEVDRLRTPLGQACIALANRLDHPGADTGSAMASVAGRLEALLAAATKGTIGATAPQQLKDELADRRAKHGV